MIKRPSYLEELKKYINVPVVKILTGVRRCGKSTILSMFKEELINNGIDSEHVIEINFASEKYSAFDSKLMYELLKNKIVDDKKYYLLLDEVQEIENWERVINSLLEENNSDIYITGSNSKLMSSEISTYLTGRYVSIPVYTLSYKEIYNSSNNLFDKKSLLDRYIRLGGFPIVTALKLNEDTAYQIIDGIYNSVVNEDIRKRHKINDEELFSRVVKFIIENVGKTLSANSICNYLKSEKRNIRVETIYNYLEWLEKSFIVYECPRYDLQGKEILKTQEKFYLSDQSLKYSLLGFDPKSIASMLENIVYLELKRRGYNVYVGKIQTQEIDFVAIKREEKIYVQVCRQMPETSDREISNLLKIRDSYPKYVVTLDEYSTGNYEGIQIVTLTDFLLNK